MISRLLLSLWDWGAKELTVSLVYSMTETGPLFRSILPLDEALRELFEAGGPIALRNCVAGWRLRCVDKAGQVVPEGIPGRVEVSSEEKLFAGYHGQPPLRAPGARGDVWFNTGDVGIIESGRLILAGRDKSTIIVNARKVTCEEIELKLSSVDELSGTTIIATPFRGDGDVTDAIAIFFVPPGEDEATISRTAKLIVTSVSSRFGLAARHVVAIGHDDVVRTATLKLKRDHLVQRYRDGDLKNWFGDPSPRTREGSGGDEDLLLRLWQRTLELSQLPRWDDSFFDLGGDSLATARLIAVVESRYAAEVPVDKFFENPTPSGMRTLIQNALAPRPAAKKPRDPLPAVAAHFGRWPGERPPSTQIMIGFNLEGSARPIFWVFQTYEEALGLANELGPDQPLYAMRSAVHVVPTKQYSEKILGSLLDRYLWEILLVSRGREFSLGGNCQGGVLALLLARRLRQIRRTPRPLFLVDWWFRPGKYDGPTVVLFGRQKSREHLPKAKRRVARQFKDRKTYWVAGRYAQYSNQVTSRRWPSA